ncbi:MAG: lysophospholipid acyltransferase family protein [Alphaproteobacteria bacterium]|nr:lysophospholipid acyltransferase family protein [Alphaproteobacteria bacterium]MCB9792941.1 lysophospholipid acyltransferase family protein [Alphaproteobacteria bacterium]
MPETPTGGERGLAERLRSLGGSPMDIARWGFWVPFREFLDPNQPEALRTLYPLWRMQYAMAGGSREQMAEELRACFGGDPDADVREAYRVAFRVHLEELLLGKLDRESWRHYMRFEGQEHLDAALDRGKGAILTLPHAGNIMMMIAAVSFSGYRYTQYAARGMPPEEVAAEHAKVMGHNRWRLAARLAREGNEDRLPANFVTLDTPVRHLYRVLKANEVIGIAYDGRIGTRFVKVDYLGREALISPGAFRIAASTGAAIVPTFCASPAEGPAICTFMEPITGRRWEELMQRFLREAAEPWLRTHRAEYGLWLLHCRQRRAVDDHPLFIDYAPDERYRVHLER